jgi:hydroxymethylpyrimidine/phosphomethylpyrimidine kinase
MSPQEAHLPRVLSIAGSDSGGGAGIQADLKAFARAGVHGMTAVTAITAQNTVAVTDVAAVSPEIIVAQVRAVAEDIGVDAVKIGMLGDERTIAAVEQALDLIPDAPVVVDPVMVAESGASLLDPRARRALVERLLPRAAVVTPNLPEARELAGAGARASATASLEGGDERADLAQEELARAVYALGPAAVVVTGGHAPTADDVFFDGERLVRISGERYPDGAAHGSGCTHSATLAARLALGDDPLEAARVARTVASEAVRDGLRGVGRGSGPVDALGLVRRSDERAARPRPAGATRLT